MNDVIFNRISALLPLLAVQDAAAQAADPGQPDVLQQMRELLGADISREMLLRVVTHWLPSIAAAAAVFLFGRLLVRLAVRMIDQASRRARMGSGGDGDGKGDKEGRGKGRPQLTEEEKQ
ncbi:MAG TPA: hypothetical protein DIT89_01015, partial [Planctomycetaceae bacterium]|nr:hypothetical protein [Planctomycetaceae bacterium]